MFGLHIIRPLSHVKKKNHKNVFFKDLVLTAASFSEKPKIIEVNQV